MSEVRNLLLCAAIDFSGQDWCDDAWQRMVASLKLGKAGDIFAARHSGLACAMRADVSPGNDAPSVRPLELQAGFDGAITLLTGRIMQRGRLAQDLDASPAQSDCELYGLAYARWGEGCDARIVGDYAAVQWFPEERRARLSRSPLQAPPLHVWRDGRRLVVASLPRSIFASGVQPRIDEAHLADAALRNYGADHRSYYLDLERVPCGAVASHTCENSSLARWWRAEDLSPLEPSSDEEHLKAAQRYMEDAISESLSDTRQAALSLSGGLDSSTIASFAAKHLSDRARLRTYTSVPRMDWLPKPDERLVYNERGNVEAVAGQWPQIEPHFVTGEESEFGEQTDAMLLLGSWPSANEMNMHWVHAIHRSAADAGCDVILHGELGDSSISYHGLTRFPHLLVRFDWLRLFRELVAYKDGRPLGRRFISYVVMPWIPRKLRRVIDQLRGNYRSPFDAWSPLKPDARPTRAALARAAQAGYDWDHYSIRDPVKSRMDMIDAPCSEGPQLNLALRLLYGIERRDPFAYRPLWEFCARLPDSVFLRDGVDRRLARLLLRDIAPPEISDQTRVAIQSADMLGRMHRDKAKLLSGLEREESTGAAGLFDVVRMRDILTRCNGPYEEGERDWLRVAALVPRGLSFLSFVRHVEGRNDG